MSKHVNEELISAYIDGVLPDEDRREVEAAIAESETLQRVHAELLEIRAGFQQLPRYELPGDFHQRVLDRAAELRPTPAVTASSQSAVTAVVAAVAVVCAALALAIFGGGWSDDPQVAVEPEVEQPAFDWEQESLVYYRAESDRRPSYSLVMDVTVTERGRDAKAFEEVLNQLGVPFDPDLALDEDLEAEMLGSRMVANVEVSDDAEGDKVEMMYVVGNSNTMDSIWAQIKNRPADFFPAPKMDLIMLAPDQRVMQGLNGASRDGFASRMSPDQKTLAHRLVLSVSLRSTDRVLGAISAPSVEANLVPVEPGSPSSGLLPQLEFSLVPPGEEVPPQPEQEPVAQAAQMSEVLFILRYPAP